jgi:monofunctional biosynthetic peptidoglycan transglycosylase
VRRVLVRVLGVLVVLQLVVVGFIGTLRFWTPSRTAYMLEDGGPVTYEHVSLDHVSRYLLAAVIAHEDEQLGTRSGAFTWGELGSRAWAFATGAPDPSGSTVPQQLAKNVFLWPHQDPLRKAVEAVLATEMSYELSDQRVLELYVNYAQFGPHLYGVCAASWYYFGEPPAAMTPYQAAQLMGVLPDPDRVRRAPGGGIDVGPTADPMAVELVNGAANVHVPRELAGMGGWQAAVATVGIHDTAAAHAGGPGDSCSAMPAAVADLIAGR